MPSAQKPCGLMLDFLHLFMVNRHRVRLETKPWCPDSHSATSAGSSRRSHTFTRYGIGTRSLLMPRRHSTPPSTAIKPSDLNLSRGPARCSVMSHTMAGRWRPTSFNAAFTSSTQTPWRCTMPGILWMGALT